LHEEVDREAMEGEQIKHIKLSKESYQPFHICLIHRNPTVYCMNSPLRPLRALEQRLSPRHFIPTSSYTLQGTTAALTSPRPSTKPTDVEPFAYKDEHHQTLRPSSKYERTQVDAGFGLGGCEEFGAEFELKCCELYAKFGFGLGGWEESKATFGLGHCEASSVKFGLGCCEERRK